MDTGSSRLIEISSTPSRAAPPANLHPSDELVNRGAIRSSHGPRRAASRGPAPDRSAQDRGWDSEWRVLHPHCSRTVSSQTRHVGERHGGGLLGDDRRGHCVPEQAAAR